jgi:S-adenosyl methyltransferase
VHKVAQSIARQSRVVYVDHDPVVLHFVTDDQDPAGITRAVMDAVPPGSYLAIGHHTADIYPEVSAFAARRLRRLLLLSTGSVG